MVSTVFGSEVLLDGWVSAHADPEPVELAALTGRDMLLDAMGRQELNLAEEKIREGWVDRNAGLVLAGLGIGAAVGASYVLPWYRGGRYAASVARASAGHVTIPRGGWVRNQNAEEVSTEWLRRLATHDRTQPSTSPLYGREQVDKLKKEILERGFDSPLMVDVDATGNAFLFDGNHRLAAALELGLDRVPVIVAPIAKSNANVEKSVLVGVRPNLKVGHSLKPSEVFSDLPPLIPERFIAVMPEDKRAGILVDWAHDSLRAAGLGTPGRAKGRSVIEGLGARGRNGGFTWNPRDGQVDWDGYGVSTVKGYTVKVPIEQFTSMHPVAYLRFAPRGTTKTVAQILAENPRYQIGSWTNEGAVWLDISSVLQDKDAALRIGGALNEKAIFDFKIMDDILLKHNPNYQVGGADYTPDALARYGFDKPVTPDVRAFGPVARRAVVGGVIGGVAGAEGSAEAAVSGGAFGGAVYPSVPAGITGALLGGLSGKSKAIVAAFRSSAYKRVLNYNGVSENVKNGALAVGYRPGVDKQYGSQITPDINIVDWSNGGLGLGGQATLGELLESAIPRLHRLGWDGVGAQLPARSGFPSAITPEQKAGIDRIVREEAEGFMHSFYEITNPAWGTAGLNPVSQTHGAQIFQVARQESRWGTDISGSVDVFNLGTRLSVNQTAVASAISLQGQVFRDRTNNIARYKIFERLIQEMPELADVFRWHMLTYGGNAQNYSRVAFVKDFIENAVPVIAIDSHDLGRIAATGKFLNQYAAKTASGDIATNGTLDPGLRATREMAIGNFDLASPATDRPIYGYFAYPAESETAFKRSFNRSLAKADESVFGPNEAYPDGLYQNWIEIGAMAAENVRQYGNVHAVLKPRVKKNLATFTVGDSLGGHAFMAPASRFSVEDLLLANVNKATQINSIPTTYHVRYIEGQFDIAGANVVDVVDYFVVRDTTTGGRVASLFPDIPVRYTGW